MYEEFHGLSKRPFLPVPNPEIFVPVSPAQEALESLMNCVEGGQGIAVLTGEAGIGKTAVCRQLIQVLSKDFTPVYLSSGAFPTRRALLQAVLYELEIGYVGLSEQEARLKVLDAAREAAERKKPLVVILDESHLLSVRLLEELRTIGDTSDDGSPLVRLVFSGQFSFEEKLAEPSLSAFNQRIGAQIYLEPLSLQQSADYILARLGWAGSREPESVFTEAALLAICRAAGGNPRCLHQLADHTLFLAFTEEKKPVDVDVVRVALEDLKELPLQWNDLADEMQELQHQQSYNEEVSRQTWAPVTADAAEFSEFVLEEPGNGLHDTDEFDLAKLLEHTDSDAIPEQEPALQQGVSETADVIPFSVFEVGADVRPAESAASVEKVAEQKEMRETPVDQEGLVVAETQPAADHVDAESASLPAEDNLAGAAEATENSETSNDFQQDSVIDIVAPQTSRKLAKPAGADVSVVKSNRAQHFEPVREKRISSRASVPCGGSVMIENEGCIETVIYDHYALIDRRDELPEDQRDLVKLGENPRPRYGELEAVDEDVLSASSGPAVVKAVELMPPGWQAAANQEMELLETIQLLRDELEEIRSVERVIVDRHTKTRSDWSEFDVVQPAVDDETVFDAVTAGDKQERDEPVRPATEERESLPVSDEPASGRFAQLFTRLRWRRERLKAQSEG